MQKNKGFILFIIIMLLTSMPAALASCGSGTNEFAEAETVVAKELDALKSGSGDIPTMTKYSEDMEIPENLVAAYADKLRDFDYVIAGSGRSEDGKSVVVTVDITTYDFGSVYLETWNDMMKSGESRHDENQFFSDLFTRFAAMSVKNYIGKSTILCTRDENGEWTTDIKTNPGLIDTISGGMVTEMTELAEDS